MLCTKETHHATLFPHRPEQHCTLRRTMRRRGAFDRAAETADAGSATLASSTFAVVASPNTTATDTASTAAVDNTAASTNDSATSRSDLAGNALSIPADAAPVDDLVLDDQALSRQRGGFSGMLMVAATPQMMRGVNTGGNGVTLWDEIAPPSQLPVPVDVARSAQGNVTSYQRN
jgi:hypothetical protein